MAASFPIASVAEVRNVRQQKWNNSQLHRGAEPVSLRGVRPSKEEQGHSLGIDSNDVRSETCGHKRSS
jgi:hypothetical protein